MERTKHRIRKPMETSRNVTSKVTSSLEANGKKE